MLPNWARNFDVLQWVQPRKQESESLSKPWKREGIEPKSASSPVTNQSTKSLWLFRPCVRAFSWSSCALYKLSTIQGLRKICAAGDSTVFAAQQMLLPVVMSDGALQILRHRNTTRIFCLDWKVDRWEMNADWEPRVVKHRTRLINQGKASNEPGWCR